MSTAITQIEGFSGGLAQWREPEEILAQAQKAAVALKKVLDLKPNKVMFNNEQYLEREDWGTAGQFFGCTAKSIETRYVEFGNVHGWEAVAVVVDRNMNEIGRAESMCLDDEESWGEVTKYEWKDKLDADGKKIWNPNLRKGKGGYEAEKVAAGTVKKPLFQLRSMAQTRAEAKALKSVFGWFVVLAGYKPTPAEELTGHEDFDHGSGREQKPPVQQPTRASEKKAAEQTGQQTTQAAEKTGEKEISGIIEKASQAKSGTLWVTVKGEPLVIAVDGDKIDGDMVPGNFIKLRGLNKHNDKLATTENPQGQFWSLIGLIELSPVQEAEVTKADDGKLAPDAAAVAGEMFGGGNAAIEELKQNGSVTTAAQLPATEAKKPGTIGINRAKRLYAIAGQNKKTTGFTDDDIKKVLAKYPPPIGPLEHLRDLPMDLYEVFEKLCTGEEDWKEYLAG